jgi:hypothetical protein
MGKLSIQELIKDVMSQQRLSWEELARRQQVKANTVRALVRRLGKQENGRSIRHHVGRMSELSVALNQRGDWLRKELRKRGQGG